MVRAVLHTAALQARACARPLGDRSARLRRGAHHSNRASAHGLECGTRTLQAAQAQPHARPSAASSQPQPPAPPALEPFPDRRVLDRPFPPLSHDAWSAPACLGGLPVAPDRDVHPAGQVARQHCCCGNSRYPMSCAADQGRNSLHQELIGQQEFVS